MRILQVNNYHYARGGADRYFLDLTALLRESGHTVRTFSTAHTQNVHPEWLAVDAHGGVDTESAGGLGNVTNFVFSRRARAGMERAIREFSPDVVHLHIYYGQLTSSILEPLRATGVPVVQTLHEYKLVCPTHELQANGKFCDACQGRSYWHAVAVRCNRGSVARSALSAIEAYVSEALGARDVVRRFIAVSEYQRSQLVRLGVPPARLGLLRHFADRPDTLPDDPGEYVLYAGRIERAKGIQVLLDAIAELGSDAPPVKIAGTGRESDRWRAYSNALGLQDKVEWLGFRDGRELTWLYRRSFAVVNPSMLNETFGLTCLEALAQGRPVIATRIGALPELVEDSQDGMLVSAGRPGDLAAAMRWMATHPDDARAMGRRGWEKVGREFSRSRHYDRLMKIYDQAAVE